MTVEDTTVPDHRSDSPDADTTAAAWGPVALIAGLTAIVLLVRCDRYGYFGDELYFLAAGRHLGPGYADQGPLIPLLARAATALAPGSLVALRLPSIMAAVAGVMVAAATAREFGGRRKAQALAAIAYATCPYLITQAASLSTFALDSTATATALWLLVRWTRVRRDRLLVAAAIVVAVDVQVKLLVLVPVAAAAAALTAVGPREPLRRRAFWLGMLIVAAAAAPGIAWQRQHGWPQPAMGAIIRDEQRSATGGVLGLPVQWAILTGLLGGLLALAGGWALLRRSDFHPYRFVGVTTILQALFVIGTGGRPYYIAACLPALFAAGAVAVTAPRHRRTRVAGVAAGAAPRSRPARISTAATVATPPHAAHSDAAVAVVRRPHPARIAGVAVIVVSVAIAVTVVAALPLPLSRLHRPTDTQAELSTRMRTFGTTGWSRLIDTVGAAYRALPADDRDGVGIVTQTYWQASAVEQAEIGPRVYSPDRGFAYFGVPPPDTRIVLYVTAGATGAGATAAFEAARPVARLDDPLGFPGIDRGVTVWRCERPRRPWPRLWRDLRTLTLDPGLPSAPNITTPERHSS
ncbi:glycosyltransferase family 39 protein [Nocardia sp. alder85J]|uniref:glycosyltransferase family 39 protein n=1 Tax=Nocardia sp. alder85J TaxID=2862949 RepID=UPI001CD75623|nr:glycosyltransferase family 39 protein [Nocardia sp. alder85J]MCX4097128.1 glycosyltransferase family 39 protein [Nocardia sp. alder85J]